MTVLNDEQCARFFDTMDALLYFVNDRFRVVEDFSPENEGRIGDMKTVLVSRTLWDNVDIIDDFVRENPMRLSRAYLDTALAWKAALPGIYAVVRYQGGRAILMNDVGVFAVGGVTLELEGEIGPTPAYVDAVLLPFDDQVIYDGFLQVYDGDGSVEEASRIQDEFETRCSGGIVSSAEEFMRVAQAHLQDVRDQELEALLADVAREAVGEEEELPAGFHRGVLADASPDTPRESALANEAERTADDIRADQAVNCAIACVIARGVEALDDAYEQYCALAPDPLTREDFEALVRHEASFPDSYFGLWNFEGRDYLTYYSITPDYITHLASLGGDYQNLREDLAYYENFRQSLLQMRRDVAPKPLSRTLLENTPLGELLYSDSAVRLRAFLNERIPDGQDDRVFADMAVQEFVLTAIESASPEDLFRVAENIGVMGCCQDELRLVRLLTNLFSAMPSWENNGWSPQDLYEQLTGRRIFFNDDGTEMKVGADDACPCGSGKSYRSCCGR